MVKVIVIYYSRGGNTRRVAEMLTTTLKEEDLEVCMKNVSDVKVEELIQYDGIAIGSPTYYGQMAGEVKTFLDETVRLHGKLDGKVGLAFTTSGGYGTGGETTILSIIQAMLIHGMIVQGDPDDLHYGIIIRGMPKDEDLNLIRVKAKRFSTLLKKLKTAA
ncbi:MAG: NAD(P)H-dependent oxidoreductase [Candidatus Bathyarchaeia archaeon]